MKQLDGKSLDIVSQNIEKIKELFPEVFSEGKINFAKLQEELGKFAEDEAQRYNFTWAGKSEAKRIAQTPSTGTLRPCKEESKDWDTTQNLYIEGDNLEVLKLLQKSYHKQVKMIYIDPPYNTGKDFVYKDNFKDNIKNYLEITGQVDSEGNRLSTNSDTNGRYHSDWLNMMYPRLKLARNLLKDDGVIFISIDDNEVVNLRKLCDEIFGEDNFVAQIMPIANPGGRDYNQIAVTHEYLLVYMKSSYAELNEIAKNITFKLQDDDGGFELRELRNRNPKFHSGNRPNLFYPFYVNHKQTDDYGNCSVSLTQSAEYNIEVRPYNSEGRESVWRWGKPKANENIIVNDIIKSQIVAKQKKDGGWNIYEKNRRSTTKVKSIWDETEMRTETGTRQFRSLFNESLFDHPKSVDLLKRAIEVGSNSNDVILDFFSGSGTAAHAVMQLNNEDNGNRKFIMTQLPEETDEKSEAHKAGYKNICEIGKERIRRAGEKIQGELRSKREHPGVKTDNADKDLSNLDIGFKVLKLDSSNIKTWDSNFENLEQNLLDSIENIKDDRTPQDLLYEILLKYGLNLTLRVEEKTLHGKKVFVIGYAALIVCLDDDITLEVVEAIAKLKDEYKSEITRVVFKDSSFENAVVKTNALQVLKQFEIDEVVSV